MPWIEDLISSLKGISEPLQRAQKVVHEIQNHTTEEITEFLHLLITSSRYPFEPFSRTQLDLLRFPDWLRQLSYDQIVAIYESATKNGWNEVCVLLRTHRYPHDANEEKPEGFSKAIESLTLGERKQMSRNLKRNQLEVLLFDPNPLVIRDLLRNPKLIERDVVRIAARHQAPPEVLTEVLYSDRWMSRYRVRKALAFNPRTPPNYVVALISQLNRRDLQELLQSKTHHESINDVIQMRIEKQT